VRGWEGATLQGGEEASFSRGTREGDISIPAPPGARVRPGDYTTVRLYDCTTCPIEIGCQSQSRRFDSAQRPAWIAKRRRSSFGL